MKISIICPTRKRPENIERLYNSAIKLSNDPRMLEFVFYVDEDDKLTRDFLKEFRHPEIKYLVGPRILLSETWNRAQEIATGKIFMHAGDDIIFRTNSWDDIVRDAFDEHNDRIMFVYGEDGASHTKAANFGTHGFLHENWIKTVGYFMPPYFSSDYNDTWWNDVATMIDRKKPIPILTEHMHPAMGKASWDENHKERLARGEQDNVKQKYIDLLNKRQEDADKLKKFIEDHLNARYR